MTESVDGSTVIITSRLKYRGNNASGTGNRHGNNGNGNKRHEARDGNDDDDKNDGYDGNDDNNNNNNNSPTGWNNPNNDKLDSALRIVLATNDDNQLYMTYRYYAESRDPDTNGVASSKFKYMLRLGKLIEYQDADGSDQPGFQQNVDNIIQTWDFADQGAWTNWQRTIDDFTGAHIYTTSNGVFTFAARISADTFTSRDLTITPDELKFDVSIRNFPWQADSNSRLALLGWIQTDMEVQQSGDSRLALDGSDAYITWVDRCDLADSSSCDVILSALYTDAAGMIVDSIDRDSNTGVLCKATVFSFVDDGSQPDEISWDPSLGSNYEVLAEESSAVSNGVSFGLVALAAAFVARMF